MYDISIIGSGIIGTFIARELSKFNLKVCVFEKNNDISNGTTMANSAIVHSGYDPEPGTNKAIYNVAGNRLYKEICEELDVTFKQIGSLTLAINDDDIKTLKDLMVRSAENEVPVEFLEREEVLKIEPNITDDVVAGLLAPTAGIVYPWELSMALMENAMDNGVELKLNHEVKGIEKLNNSYKIVTNEGEYFTSIIINAAGVYADEIHNMVADPQYSITPRRGQYFVLNKNVGDLVNHVVFPCPTDKGKGILITPTTHGNILVGPSSEYIADKDDVDTTVDIMNYVRANASKYIKDIPFHAVIRSFSGLRPTSDRHDFIIEEAKDAKGFIDVGGIESPGLASAPAIAKEVINIISNIIKVEENEEFNPHRKPFIEFNKLPIEEKQKLIKENPKYGKIICRCESITEGEILDAIYRNAGATTVKGVKMRARAGMGLCQGGFCQPLVVDILARELNIDPKDVLFDAVDSNILIEETKQ